MAAAAGALVAASVSVAASSSPIQVIDDANLQAISTTVGGVAGADVLNTANTVPHWFGSTLNPHNGVTYGYNMVGANPTSGVSTTVEADITPVNVNFAGRSFNGTDVLAATLASPQFATSDYGSTAAATVPGAFPLAPALTRGPGGVLSQGDAGRQLQLEDATMRAQFNQTGSSTYHVLLHPNVLPAVTIDVPSTQGVLAASGRGVIFPLIKIKWWATRIQNLNSTADPTHLPIYLTNDVLLSVGTGCCVIGFHGAGLVPGSSNAVNGGGHGNGSQPVQTYAWATYLMPGLFARANGGTDWAVQDIHPLSHEISEWADDPFVNSFVEPWLTPTAPQYGCTGILETGDPVVGIGFAQGANTFAQGPNPNGSQSADGYYHPEDEALLPWFMRTAPNNVSEPTQTASANIGRYTFMGDLNPFPGFRQPATGC